MLPCSDFNSSCNRSYDECVTYIHSFFRYKKKVGLLGITKLLELLDNPHKKLSFVHIGGTNGKGSTTAMISNVLKHAGYKVGIFTSPYIIDFRERFVVNETMIPKETLVEIVSRIKPLVDMLELQDIPITEFEVVTAIGMCYFAQENCDIVCLEVGLGGRFDPTNVIDPPLISCITSISLDHTDILGDTIEKIAFDKAFIIKENTTAICYPVMDTSALSVIMQRVALTNSTLILPNKNSIIIHKTDINGNYFTYNDIEYFIPLAGIHQIYNAVLAIEACTTLIAKGFNLSPLHIKHGLNCVKWIGRLEVISTNPLLIIDGAHNVDGTLALSRTINALPNKRKIVVLGMLGDKDYKKSAQNILTCADVVITVNIDNPRTLESSVLGLETNNQIPTYICDSMQDGVSKALSIATCDDAIILCGSLYLISEFKQQYKGDFKW